MGKKFVAFQRKLDWKPKEDSLPAWARALGPKWKWSLDEPFGGVPEDARGRCINIFLAKSRGQYYCTGHWFSNPCPSQSLNWRDEDFSTIIGYRVVD